MKMTMKIQSKTHFVSYWLLPLITEKLLIWITDLFQYSYYFLCLSFFLSLFHLSFSKIGKVKLSKITVGWGWNGKDKCEQVLPPPSQSVCLSVFLSLSLLANISHGPGNAVDVKTDVSRVGWCCVLVKAQWKALIVRDAMGELEDFRGFPMNLGSASRKAVLLI